jgi:hypothetical protein
MMAENKSNDARDPAPPHNSADQNGTGYTPEEATQESAERAGQNRQSATGGESAGHVSNFNSAPPESNVGPAGAAQNSHGFAGQAPKTGGPTQ